MNFKYPLMKLLSGIREGKDLSSRLAKSSVWLSIGSGVEQALRFLRNMILTRMLLPDVFGEMAIIYAVDVFFDSLTQIGIREAIIQNPEGDQDTFLNGAWWFSLGRVTVLYMAAYFASPFIARFYNDLNLIPMMRVVFLSILFRGVMSARAHVVVKRLDFRRWIFIEQLGGAIGVLLSILLAFILRNVWALIIGFTSEAFLQMGLSYLICPYIPRFKFNKDHLIALFKYSRGMLGLPILTFIFMRTDIFVVGKLHSSEELGLYSMAVTLARMSHLFMQKFIAPMFMPAFSEMQNDLERINRAILRINSAFAFIGFPIIALAALYSAGLLGIIYTPQYAQVSIPFAIIFLSVMLMNFNMPIVSVYMALGHLDRLRLFVSLRAILILVLIYPAVKIGGPVGAALAVLISMLLSYVFQIANIRKLTQLKVKSYVAEYLIGFFFSFPVILAGLLTRKLFPSMQLAYLGVGLSSLIGTYLLLIVLYQGLKERFFKIIPSDRSRYEGSVRSS